MVGSRLQSSSISKCHFQGAENLSNFKRNTKNIKMSFIAKLNKLWTFGDEIGAVQKGSQSNAINSTVLVVGRCLLWKPFSRTFSFVCRNTKGWGLLVVDSFF